MQLAGGAPSCATFAIRTELCPQILCRLLGLIAQQGRMVEWVEARRGSNCLHVSLSVAGIDRQQAEIVAAKMRSLVPVQAVSLLAPACLPYGAAGKEEDGFGRDASGHSSRLPH